MRIQLITGQDTLTLTDNRLDQRSDAWIRQDGIDGLTGTPKPRETAQAIPQQDGSYWPARLTSESRTLTIRCAAAQRSSLSLARLVDRINALACQPLTVRVEDAMGWRELTGWLADDPGSTLLVSLQSMTFSLVVYCPDPLKYGPRVQVEASHGVAQVENVGSAPTWPTVSTKGITGWTLSLAGRKVSWSGSTDPMDLAFASMNPSQGLVTYDDAFPLLPGISNISVQTQGAGQLTVSLRPAWR